MLLATEFLKSDLAILFKGNYTLKDLFKDSHSHINAYLNKQKVMYLNKEDVAYKAVI